MLRVLPRKIVQQFAQVSGSGWRFGAQALAARCSPARGGYYAITLMKFGGQRIAKAVGRVRVRR